MPRTPTRPRDRETNSVGLENAPTSTRTKPTSRGPPHGNDGRKHRPYSETRHDRNEESQHEKQHARS